MAIVILVGWISYLPSIQLHGLELAGRRRRRIVLTFALLILPPILVLAIAALASERQAPDAGDNPRAAADSDQHLGVVAFGIGVAIYGF